MEQNDLVYACCIMNPDGDSGVKGLVQITQPKAGGKTTITAHMSGLTPGKHGFHIHEFGNLLDGRKTAGAHYNPFNKTHGAPWKEERHVGDMGNVEADADGNVKFVLEDHLIQLTGETSVIGRTCVVHADEDDLGETDHPLSKTTGNAGARLACGVIGISGPFEMPK